MNLTGFAIRYGFLLLLLGLVLLFSIVAKDLQARDQQFLSFNLFRLPGFWRLVLPQHWWWTGLIFL